MLLRPLEVGLSHLNLDLGLSHLNLDEENFNGLISAVFCITHGDK